jgi:uncharacterized small protein (DUF1192 family)
MNTETLNRKLMEWAQEPDGLHLLSVLEAVQTLAIDAQVRIAALEAQVSDDGKRIVALGEHNAVYQSARNVEFDARIAALEEALARLTGEAQS